MHLLFNIKITTYYHNTKSVQNEMLNKVFV